MLNECAEAFREHILLDKNRVDELYERFGDLIIKIGRRIIMHYGRAWEKDKKEYEELWDFIDGNGFILNRCKDPRDVWPIEIKIVYREGEKRYEETEPVNSYELFLQKVVLFDPSVEVDEPPILEYTEFLAPWKIWLCIHRCLEFLYVVPASCGRSAPLPRPP